MTKGWSIKDAGRVLGINPKKVPQALAPAMRKIARLMLVDSRATMTDLLAAMQQAEQDTTLRYEKENSAILDAIERLNPYEAQEVMRRLHANGQVVLPAAPVPDATPDESRQFKRAQVMRGTDQPLRTGKPPRVPQAGG